MAYLALFLFVGLFLWRYIRLVVNLVASWTFQPIMPSLRPQFLPADVTVIIPTLTGRGNLFIRCIDSIVANCPCKIIVVTPDNHVSRLRKQLRYCRMVTVIGIDKPSKRVQMVRGLRLSKTAITAFVDDDIIWPSTYLPMVLAAFEDPAVGAAGSCQRMLRVANPNVWHILGAMYLERRNFEFSATLHMDGGTSCLSGRTSFHRTFILQNDAFINGFLEETWMGWVPLMTADDDNFVTRWLVNHGWKIRVQYCKEAELSTTLEASPMFIFQCVRWARSNWRSNTTSMFVDRVVWRKQPWSSFALHLAMLNPPAAIMDGLLAYLLYLSTHEIEPKLLPSVLTGFVLWLLFTKLVKLLPHFHRYPKDLRFFPAIVLFGYFHGLVKLYALLTIHKTNWGGRKIASSVTAVAWPPRKG